MPKEIKLDKWSLFYSERAALLKSSAIRNLFSLIDQPDIISMAGGAPYTKAIPPEKVIDATIKVMSLNGSSALQYGPARGYEGLKKYITELLSLEEIYTEPDDILITDGAQQGLDLVTKIFINPGDTILAEGPSYVGALQSFLSYQANVIHISMDSNGIKTNLVANKLKELLKKHKLPKFIYVVPNFQNPAGITMSEERRKHLLSLAEKFDLLILEDNPYGAVRFESENIPSLIKRNKERIIYLGTFSKIFSPGVRLGWVIAPRPILEKLVIAKEAANLCASEFTQRIVEVFFRDINWNSHIKKLVFIYRNRCKAMLQALEKYAPRGVSWTKPQGGLFLWLTLPKYIDTSEMLAQAIEEEKVAYVPGDAFYANGQGRNCMRLNFSYPNEDEIKEGIRRLGKVIKKQIDMYKLIKEGEKEA